MVLVDRVTLQPGACIRLVLEKSPRLRGYAPTSNTARHNNYEKINSWVSFTFLLRYGAPLVVPSGRRNSAKSLQRQMVPIRLTLKQLGVGWIKLKSDQSALPLLTTTLGAVNLASFLLCHLSVNLYSETKHTCTQHWRGDEWYQTLLLQISDTHCLQTSLLIFKSFANHRRKELFVSTANEPLVGTLMTIGDLTVSIAIEWSLEFKGKTDACCSDSCPFVTCRFWYKSSLSGIKFYLVTVAWNSAGFYSCVMKRKSFILFS